MSALDRELMKLPVEVRRYVPPGQPVTHRVVRVITIWKWRITIEAPVEIQHP